MTQSGAYFIPRGQYQGIANTIVQLIRRGTPGVIAPSQPIRSEERHCRKTMSIIDKALEANRNYAKNYNPWALLAQNPPSRNERN
jgi:uncharacterized membrane protein